MTLLNSFMATSGDNGGDIDMGPHFAVRFKNGAGTYQNIYTVIMQPSNSVSLGTLNPVETPYNITSTLPFEAVYAEAE